MIRVAIETATPLGTVAVGDGDRVLVEIELGAQRRHAETALPALADALEEAGVDRSRIAEVVVGAGPGSFTGVRVAGATAKGLAAALEVPLVAYPSLLALAAAAAHDHAPDGPVLALFDARRGEVYGGCWQVGEAGVHTLLAPLVGTVEEVAAAAAAAAGGAALLAVGDGAKRNAAALAAVPGIVVRPEPAAPRAAWLLHLSARHRAAGEVADAAAWEPLYVRDSSARVQDFGVGGGGAG